MNIDWSKPICTQHGRPLIGVLMPGRGAGNTRRVALPSLSARKPSDHLTVFLYAEDGISRCDRAPSEYDLVNFDRANFDNIQLSSDAMRSASWSAS